MIGRLVLAASVGFLGVAVFRLAEALDRHPAEERIEMAAPQTGVCPDATTQKIPRVTADLPPRRPLHNRDAV